MGIITETVTGHNVSLVSHIDFNSGKDARRAAVFVQWEMLRRGGFTRLIEAGIISKWRLVQLGLVPTQAQILNGLYHGAYTEYLRHGS